MQINQSVVLIQCMLHYKSALLQSLSVLFFSLPMVTGFWEEKQMVPVQLHESYVEDSVSVSREDKY